ncbi:hypothetical protein IP81_14810 [Novosphingobium sp. AAP83]|uniref:hypothetical protein n=1 Tax=Novosphingobium sp. AAP83 TaxID=1523425 RepID=UPI0006B884BA|nr:hypothetical protein [Novosphingobium sp. AAP83]KPF90619.1 hypothetical protein IP81_14810 [Novosphingobium sp. AAP83]
MTLPETRAKRVEATETTPERINNTPVNDGEHQNYPVFASVQLYYKAQKIDCEKSKISQPPEE